jgi:hypothetical protein
MGLTASALNAALPGMCAPPAEPFPNLNGTRVRLTLRRALPPFTCSRDRVGSGRAAEKPPARPLRIDGSKERAPRQLDRPVDRPFAAQLDRHLGDRSRRSLAERRSIDRLKLSRDLGDNAIFRIGDGRASSGSTLPRARRPQARRSERMRLRTPQQHVQFHDANGRKSRRGIRRGRDATDPATSPPRMPTERRNRAPRCGLQETVV